MNDNAQIDSCINLDHVITKYTINCNLLLHEKLGKKIKSNM